MRQSPRWRSRWWRHLSMSDNIWSSRGENSMFIRFHQFVYCSRDEVYFPKLSCLVAADGGTLHSKWTAYNGCYASHSWRHKATYYVTAALWCHVVRGCLGDVWNKAGLDTYFFLNLSVGQPSNNMDLSEIEIYLGTMIIFFLFRKKSGRTVYLLYIQSLFQDYCVWSTLSHNKSLVFFSRSFFSPFWRHRDQEYISRDIRNNNIKHFNSERWKK